MVFDKLGTSLRAFGRQPLEKAISFSKQLLLALRYLHDTVGMMHCDVKPDNMLVRHDGMAVKLCDFGAAGFAGEKQHIDELQPLFYRAPEVLIGAPRGRKIDIWSTGCTIFELATGRILFRDCNSVRDCVEKIMRLRGVIPESMRKQARHEKTFFTTDPDRFLPEAGGPQNLSSFKAKPMYQELAGLVDFGQAKGLSAQDLAKIQLSRLIGGASMAAGAGKQAATSKTDGEKQLGFLAELIESCMNVDPSLRISAKDAVKVTVFKDVLPAPEALVQDAPPLPTGDAPELPAPEPAMVSHRLSSNVATVELVWEHEG
jgi:serine/threonine protein kinase